MTYEDRDLYRRDGVEGGSGWETLTVLTLCADDHPHRQMALLAGKREQGFREPGYAVVGGQVLDEKGRVSIAHGRDRCRGERHIPCEPRRRREPCPYRRSYE